MEKLKKTLIISGGIIFLLLGLFHMSFWFILDWKNELIKLSEINSNVMQMLNIGIIVFLLSFGSIMIFYRHEILNSRLGKVILLIFSFFFLTRLIAEFAYPGGSLVLSGVLFLCVLIYMIPAIIKR